MDVGAVLIAVAGVAGTLGGALLTQRGAEKAKRRELGVTESSGADHAVEMPSYYGDSTALLRDFEERVRTP